MSRRRPVRRRTGIALPALAALLCAAALLVWHHTGGEAQADALLDALSSSRPFVASSFALETGLTPSEDSLRVPSAARQAAPAAGTTETAAESAYPSDETAAADDPPAAQDGRAATVELRNDTDYTVDAAAMLDDPCTVRVTGDGPQVLIYHTHSTEAYTPDPDNPYKPSGSYRTRDAEQNVIRVGDELCRTLEAHGIQTVHITEIFDDPAYNGSYGRSLTAAQKVLAQYPDIPVTIDLHRDAVVLDDGSQYRTAAEIGGQTLARMMLVVGTDASGLSHPDWRQNLNFAVNLQADLEGAYPGLMRPVNLRRQRFNTHLRPGSLLLEVGSSGDTLDEALKAVRLFGDALAARIGA